MNMSDPTQDQITRYIKQRAQKHRDVADKGGKNASYHRGTAIIFDALAGDIAAGLYDES